MCDKDIYALFAAQEELDRSKPAKVRRVLTRNFAAKQEDLESIKPAQDLLLNVANPLRIAWWF